jgi:hypothetical protein
VKARTLQWLVIMLGCCIARCAVGQKLDSLVELPKETLVQMAVDILKEQEVKADLTIFDDVTVWTEGAAVPAFPKSELKKHMLEGKQERQLVVRFNQHFVFLPKKRKKRAYGIKVDVSRRWASFTGYNRMGVNADIFAPNRRQRSKIDFVKKQIISDERLNHLCERSKESGGAVRIRDEGSYYDVTISISRGEEYSFELERTGEKSEVSRFLVNSVPMVGGSYRIY